MRLLVLLSTLSVAWSYKILAILNIPSKSHNHCAKGIVNSLLDAGHEVTFATPFPESNPRKNLRQIDMSALRTRLDMLDMVDPQNSESIQTLMKDLSKDLTSMTLDNKQLQQVLIEEQFDAVITEWFFSDFEAGYAAIQQAPWIVLGSTVMNNLFEELVDDARSISTHPIIFNYCTMPMSLWNRLKNTFMYAMISFDKWIDFSTNKAIYESLFTPIAEARGVPLPPFSDVSHNVSILLVNSHPSIAASWSLPQNVVNIAGYHIDEKVPPLPKDLQVLLDSSPQGVVYFSMGSVAKSSALSETTQKELLQVFSELSYTVLWKFETELKNVPKNVHVRSWMPQASILAHPNLKVFISHCGMLSTLEAVQSGVPVLCVPVFADQPANAVRSVQAGFARRVTFKPDMAGELKTELKEMLANDSYYKKAQYLSKLFRKRPTPPRKLISHFIEIAIESKAEARGVPLPPFSDVSHNVSILLVNSHPSIAASWSLPQNVVNIAGYHIDEKVPPLPKDLQVLLDSSPQGVVYFSMGSVAKSSALSETTQKELLQVFSELSYTVLWKFETELKNVPKNVHVRSWMPQASILAHPNLKVFISHCGMLSTLEAVQSGVPVLCVPVFADQPANAVRSVQAGFARRVTFKPDMAGELKTELKEMLANDSYYKKAQYLSKLFRKRPTPPRKLISHFIEIAIESKGAYHLRSATHLYAWYERWMLDQLAILAVVLYVCYITIKKVLLTLKHVFGYSKKQKRN